MTKNTKGARSITSAGPTREWAGIPAQAPRDTASKLPVAVPSDVAVIQTRRAPSGHHPQLGHVIEGGVYTAALRVAAELTAGDNAEFVPFNDDEAAKIKRYAERQKEKANRGERQAGLVEVSR